MKDKLDVFEILGTEHKEIEPLDQEQITVPDSDFNKAIKNLEERYSDKSDKKSSQAAKYSKKKFSFRINKWLKWFIVIAVILLFFTFVVNVPTVVGQSMEPTLKNGDRVVVNLLARNYEVGDIIVFETESGDKLVKRIVAVPGDVVDITPDKGLCINDREMEEQYVYTETTATDMTVVYPVIVNEDTYFVMGDNRSNSKDSRNSDIGLVNKNDIVGKVVFCWRKF